MTERDTIYRLRDVSFDYPGDDGAPVPALRGISLDIKRGELLVVAGANASGKTTLALLLAGILRPTAGELAFHGTQRADPGYPFPGVTVLFQNPENTFVAPTLEEDVAFGPENAGRDPIDIRCIVDGSLARVGLAALAHRHPATLSGGQQQLAALAGVLACSPAVLILDEATSYLDAPHRRLVLELVEGARRAEGVTVVMITQETDELWDADRLLVLQRGEMIHLGPPPRLLQDPEACRRLGLEADPLVLLAGALAREGIAVPPGRPTIETLEACLAPRR